MKVINLGHINYLEALKRQEQMVEEVIAQREKEVVFICSHPPVVTLGRKSRPEDISSWTGEVVETKRGGQVTYHGPGQIVAYPIIDLIKRNHDIYLYLRQLELAISQTLAHFNLDFQGDPKRTGVWTQGRKIASIGVAIKRWVTYHGLAVNINIDPQAFCGINPCGMNSQLMTNLETELKMIHNSDYDDARLKGVFSTLLAKNLTLALAPEQFLSTQSNSCKAPLSVSK